MVAGRLGGFTLVEALVAMVLSSVLVMLVGTTFLVQNQYYSSQTLHAGVRDNARVATERIATELRSTKRDGIITAGARTLTIRSPIVMALICARSGGGDADLQSEGGEVGLNVAEVAGLALRDSITGDWEYASGNWSFFNDGDGSSANRCATNGADTARAFTEFHRVRRMEDFSDNPVVGDALMIYRETTYKIQDSQLEPGQLALFRRSYGGSFVELATGIDPSARFQYRTGGTTYADTINSGSLDDIDAVRIVAAARRPARSGGQSDITFGWEVIVYLRDVP